MREFRTVDLVKRRFRYSQEKPVHLRNAVLKGGSTAVMCFLVVLAINCLLAQAALAGTVQVGSCLTGPPQYATIQSAVNANPPGTTIRICPGSYPEQVMITKTLVLSGVENDSGVTPVVVPPATGIVQNATGLADGSAVGAQILVQNASGVNIMGLTVDGAGNQLTCTMDLIGIYYQNASGNVSLNVARNQNLGTGSQCQSGEGIYAQSGYDYSGTANVVVANNNVYGYQKNGVSGDGDTLTMTIEGNDVVGAGPDPYVAQNGIQITNGTKGTIQNNTLSNDVYTGATYSATGILIYAASGLNLKGNTIADTQGVVIYSGGSAGSADQTTIVNNHVYQTDTYDGIDACSNGNTIVSNVVFGSSEGGIHLDDSCTESNGAASGNNNSVTQNRINDVCAGLLLGSGTGNATVPNTVSNANFRTLPGDSCTVAAGTTRTRRSRAQLMIRRP